jgi:murein DD-endopeptidase MepM/ murein hydrolase activator NlpD
MTGFRTFVFACVFALGLGSPTSLFAATATEIQAQIDANQQQLKTLEAQIAAYQKELATLGSKKNTLQSAIDSLTVSQKQLSTQIKATENKIASANLEIRKLTESIGSKEESIRANQDAIAKALRTIAIQHNESVVTSLISSDSLGAAWRRVDENVQFNRGLTEDIEDLREVRSALEDNRTEVGKAKESLVALQRDLGLQKRAVDANKAEQQQLLAQTKNQEENYQKLLSDKRAEEAAFEEALFELSSQLQYVLDPSTLPPVGKGVLRWPLDDVYLTQQFGKTSSSGRLYASGTHDGIDFRTKNASYPTGIGMPIKAALFGTVLEVNHGAVPNCQYGKWVLIRHPNGLSTLYGHLSTIDVAKGQQVNTRQVIGLSGNTGYSIGAHLHFTVYAADAVTFKNFRCRSGSTVRIPIASPQAYLNPLLYL